MAHGYLQHARDWTITRDAIIRLSARLDRAFTYGELAAEVDSHDALKIDGHGYAGALEVVAVAFPGQGAKMLLMTDADWRGAFLAEIGEYHGDEAAVTATEVLEGLDGLGLHVRRQDPVPSKGLAVGVIEPSISTWNATLLVGHGRGGTIGWELLRLRKHNPFRIQAKEDELRRMLALIPGFVDRPDYPTVRWVGLAEGGLQPFLEAASWTAERVRRSNPAG